MLKMGTDYSHFEWQHSGVLRSDYTTLPLIFVEILPAMWLKKSGLMLLGVGVNQCDKDVVKHVRSFQKTRTESS